MEMFNNEQGTCSISTKALLEIGEIACSDIKNIEPAKKDNFIKIYFLEDNLINVVASIKIKKGINITKTCKELQDAIIDSYELMMGMTCNEVNIEINGFILYQA